MAYRLTDKNGKPLVVVGTNATTAQVKQAVVSGIIDGSIELPMTASGGTLSFPNLKAEWQANAQTAYEAAVVEMRKSGYAAIPVFIQSDLHGRSNEPQRWMHNTDKRVKNLCLGDIVTDEFNMAQLTAYYNSAKGIANLATVYGNHDAFTGSPSNEIANEYDLNECYVSTNRRLPGKWGYYSAVDDAFNVKYLAIVPYYMNADGTRDAVEVRTKQMEWLLRELSADDGYDIVVLMHQLFTDTTHNRAGVTQTWADAPVILENLWTVMKDRRNNRNGTITDSSGVTHNYDFTNCKNRLLCSFHGHSHEELMLTEDNMTAYVANWCGDSGACALCLIDRESNKLKVWQIKTTGVDEMLELNI